MIILKTDSELGNYFSNEIILTFYHHIQKLTGEYLMVNKNPLPTLYGCFILKDVPNIQGVKTNVFIEYDVKIVSPVKILDAGFRSIIMFDKITDHILDRYNLIKSTISP